MTLFRGRARSGFTLLDLLTVVALLVLLVSIAFPAVAKMQDSTRRTMCVENMHRLMDGVLAYAGDHAGKGPMRGWFSYTITEHGKEAGWGGSVKVGVNLGMLHTRYNGGDHNRLYCPSTYAKFREDPWSGWTSAFNPDVRWTYGSYNYATVLQQRILASPVFVGAEPYPKAQWSSTFQSWIQNTWTPRHPGITFEMPSNPCLFSDMWVGGLRPVHGSGINVAYIDGHIRYHDISAATYTSGSTGQFDVWYKLSLRQ